MFIIGVIMFGDSFTTRADQSQETQFFTRTIDTLKRLNNSFADIKSPGIHEFIQKGDLANAEGLDPSVYDRMNISKLPESVITNISARIHNIKNVAQEILNDKHKFDSLSKTQKVEILNQVKELIENLGVTKQLTNQLIQLVENPNTQELTYKELKSTSKDFLKVINELGQKISLSINKSNLKDMKDIDISSVRSAFTTPSHLRDDQQIRTIDNFNAAFNYTYDLAIEEANKIHEEFVEKHPTAADLNINPATLCVEAPAVILIDAFKIAHERFPELLAMATTPEQKSQVNTLIQTMIVGQEKVNRSKEQTDLLYIEMGFVIAETVGKSVTKPLEDIPIGHTIPEHTVGRSNFKDPVDIKAGKFAVLLKLTIHRFMNDSIIRPGINTTQGGQSFNLGAYRLEFIDNYSTQYLSYLTDSPDKLAEIEQRDEDWMEKLSPHLMINDNFASLLPENEFKELLLADFPKSGDSNIVDNIVEKLRVPKEMQDKLIEAGMSPREAESVLRIQFLRMAIVMQQSLAALPLRLNLIIGKAFGDNPTLYPGTQAHLSMSYQYDDSFDKLEVVNHYNFTTPQNQAEDAKIRSLFVKNVVFATFEGTVHSKSLSMPSDGKEALTSFETMQKLQVSYLTPPEMIDHFVDQYK